MSAVTTAFANQIIDHITGEQVYSAPSTLYVALVKSDPGDGGDISQEVTSASYARSTISFNAAASRSASNDATVDFPQALEPWGTVTHWALMDAATGGNMLFYGAMLDGANNSAPRIVQVGDIVRLSALSATIRVP